jgi:murein L,D-transpeptidase YcbB/YkuD
VLLALLLAAPVLQGAPRVPAHRSARDSVVAATLDSIASRGVMRELRWSNLADVRAPLAQVYAAREWAPLWSAGGRLTPAARAMVASLAHVADRGLDPLDYDIARLGTLAQAATLDADERAEFDMTLSVATLRVLRGLYFGRVSPSVAAPTLHIVRDSIDVTVSMEQLATSLTPDQVLDAAEPPFAQYRALKRTLARYRDRGLRDSAAFVRASQIAITMERWRWLPRDTTAPSVIVNIAAYSLDAFIARGDSVALHMGVVVGRTDGHQTPLLADSIRYLEFAPYWNVPLSIAKAELLPMAMRDPHVLTVNNYEIVNDRGQVVVPSRKTLRMVTAGTAYIRQLPGGSNSLGRVKFMFPNTFDVYLHDSPVQSDFARARRDQSHGCVRLSDPLGLAAVLLRDQPDWDTTRITAAMKGARPTRVALTRPVPVYLFYATVVAQDDGGVQFYDDVYGADASLAALLRAGGTPSVVTDAALTAESGPPAY